MAKKKTIKKNEKKQLAIFVAKQTGVHNNKIKLFSEKGHPHTYMVAIRSKKERDIVHSVFSAVGEKRQINGKPQVVFDVHNKNSDRSLVVCYNNRVTPCPVPDEGHQVDLLPWKKQGNERKQDAPAPEQEAKECQKSGTRSEEDINNIID